MRTTLTIAGACTPVILPSVTCAVGLEVMLRQEKGVAWAKASYPDASVVIKYHPGEISEDSLKNYISSMGFKAQEAKG